MNAVFADYDSITEQSLEQLKEDVKHRDVSLSKISIETN